MAPNTAVLLVLAVLTIGVVDAQVTTCLNIGDSSGLVGSCGNGIDFFNDCDGGEIVFNFVDSSGFVSVTSVSYVWNGGIDCGYYNYFTNTYDIELNTVQVGTYSPGSAFDGSCSCPHPPGSEDIVTGAAPTSAYNLGAANVLSSENIDAYTGPGNNGEACQGVSVISGCLAEVTVFGSFSGGGGDPHLWGPALEQPRFDLGGFARARTMDNTDMDVVLVEAEGVELRGHVRSKPGTDRQYFTELSLVSGEETIVISSVVDETDAWMAVRQADHVASCLSTDDAVQLDISSASAVTNCATALERATTNPFMKTHFSSHIEHVMSAVTIETSSFVVEVFYVQKGRADDGTWTETPFGFFDFHIRLAHPTASFDGLLGSTSTSRERDATPEESIHHFNEHLLGHVTFV